MGVVHQRTELVGIESIRAFIYTKCYSSYIIGKSMSSTPFIVFYESKPSFAK